MAALKRMRSSVVARTRGSVALHAEVGDARRAGGAERGLDLVAAPRERLGRGCVPAVSNAGLDIDEDVAAWVIAAGKARRAERCREYGPPDGLFFYAVQNASKAQSRIYVLHGAHCFVSSFHRLPIPIYT